MLPRLSTSARLSHPTNITAAPSKSDFAKNVQPDTQLGLIIKSFSFTEEEDTQVSSITSNRFFKAFVTMATLLNMVQMGLEADHPDWRGWLIVENIFASIFVIEMVIKVCALRKEYFTDRANLLDGGLALLGGVDCWVLKPLLGGDSTLQTFSILRILRLLRLTRLLRLVQMVKPLILVLQGVLASLSTSIYVLIVCVLVIYVFAVFLTQTLGKPDENLYPGYSSDAEVIDSCEFMEQYNPHVYFGTMLASMVTLFNMATFTEWPEVIRPLIIKQPLYLTVFLLFVTLVGFGLMNVLIGIIVDSVIAESKRVEMEFEESLKNQKLMMLDRIQTMLLEMDKDNDGIIDLAELSDALKENRVLKDLVAQLHLPIGWSAKELVEMLDRNGDGYLNHEDFTTSFFRLLDSNDFQKQCIMHADINHLKGLLQDQNKHFGTVLGSIQRDIAAMKSVLGVSRSQPEDACMASLQTAAELLGKSAMAHIASMQYSQEQFMENDQGLIERIELVVKECINEEFTACKYNLIPELTCQTPQSTVLDADHENSRAASRTKRTSPHLPMPEDAPMQHPGNWWGDSFDTKAPSRCGNKASQSSLEVVLVKQQPSCANLTLLASGGDSRDVSVTVPPERLGQEVQDDMCAKLRL